VVRYEHANPGDLVHIDTKKLGRIERMSHRVTGNRRDTAVGGGWEFLFVAVDDNSRIAFTDLYPDERKPSAIQFVENTLAYFGSLGVRIRAVLTDNGPAFRSKAFRHACARLGLKQRFTRAYRPQTQRQGRALHPIGAAGMGIRGRLQPLIRARADARTLATSLAKSDYVRNLLWKHKDKGGFEAALEELQTAFAGGDKAKKPELDVLQSAMAAMFQDMNAGFFAYQDWEFTNDRQRMLRGFLPKFDAIFTLNQDVLVEHHYVSMDVSLLSDGRWRGSQLPGMQPIQNDEDGRFRWSRWNWHPLPKDKFVVDPRTQPLYKLHGSSNWTGDQGGPLLIIGGNKAHAIESHQVLAWYFEEFRRWLSERQPKLMVIGYSFRDEHINDAIVEAVQKHGLKLFLIDPAGTDLVKPLNPSYGGAVHGKPTELEEAFKCAIIGASRRPLREIFHEDHTVEFNKVQRFFK